MSFKEKLEESIACGYVKKRALAEVDKLSADEIRLLAAMTITYHDSPWSDSQRDLARGTTLVLERPFWWDQSDAEQDARIAAEEAEEEEERDDDE